MTQTETNFMPYDLNSLNKKYKDKNYLEIVHHLSLEVMGMEKIISKIPKNDKYRFEDYFNHAGDLLYFLNTGAVPGTIGLEGLRLFLPIFQNLVAKGQLKESALDCFK